MKSQIEIEEEVYRLLNVPSVTSVLNGEIFKMWVADDYQLEAIIIKGLALTGNQLQAGIVNVNILVPDKPIMVGGVMINNQPDNARLKQVFQAVHPILSDSLINGMVTSIEKMTTIRDEALKAHYINIRVRINSINL